VVNLHFLCFVVLIYLSPYPLHFTEIAHQISHYFYWTLQKVISNFILGTKWPSIKKNLQNSFSQKGYNLSREKIRKKKLANMLTTYKRVKNRRRATGEGKITWDYYCIQ